MLPPSVRRSTRQQTLTQIDFVSRVPPASTEDLEYLEDDLYPAPSPKRRRLSREEKELGAGVDLRLYREQFKVETCPSYPIKPPTTPQKPRKEEVPSSQSPDDSQSPIAKGARGQKTALREISSNRRRLQSPAGSKAPQLRIKSGVTWENKDSQASDILLSPLPQKHPKRLAKTSGGSNEQFVGNTGVQEEPEIPETSAEEDSALPKISIPDRRIDPEAVIQDSEDEDSEDDEIVLPALRPSGVDNDGVLVAPTAVATAQQPSEPSEANIKAEYNIESSSILLQAATNQVDHLQRMCNLQGTPIKPEPEPEPEPEPLSSQAVALYSKSDVNASSSSQSLPLLPATNDESLPSLLTDSQAASAQLVADIAYSTQHPPSSPYSSSIPQLSQPAASSQSISDVNVRFSQASTVSQCTPIDEGHDVDETEHHTPPTSPTESEDNHDDAHINATEHISEQNNMRFAIFESQSQLLPESLMNSWLPPPPIDSDDESLSDI